MSVTVLLLMIFCIKILQPDSHCTAGSQAQCQSAVLQKKAFYDLTLLGKAPFVTVIRPCNHLQKLPLLSSDLRFSLPSKSFHMRVLGVYIDDFHQIVGKFQQ